MTPERRVAWAAWVSVAAFAVLWMVRWPGFPLVLDPYYHLLIGEQVAQAGGPIAYEWWEAAPGGRPHLYPPVLHVLLGGLLAAGTPPLAAVRIFSVVLPVALVTTIWLVTRRLFGPRIGLACVWTALLPFAFHLHSAITMAATLGMVLLLWMVAAVERGRWIAAGLLLMVLCYTHLGLPVVAVVTLLAAAATGTAPWRTVVRSAWGIVPALPWYAHLAAHRGAFEFFVRKENAFVELAPALYALALLGAWMACRGRREWRWLVSLLAGFALLGIHHQFRWVSGEGMMPIALLAGLGLARVVWGGDGQAGVRWSVALAAAAALLLSPTLARSEDGRWIRLWADAAPWHLVNAPWAVRKTIDTSFVTPPIERLAAVIAEQSQPGEILWSNAPYVIGTVAALSRRPMASMMFSEVRAAQPADPVGSAHLLVWVKYEPFPGTVTLRQLEQYPIRIVAEDDVTILLRQSGATELAKSPRAAVPGWLAAGLLVLALAGAAADLHVSRQGGTIPL